MAALVDTPQAARDRAAAGAPVVRADAAQAGRAARVAGRRDVVPVRSARPRPTADGLRPPTRRRVAGVPRVVATPTCAPRRPALPLAVLIGLGAAVAAVVFGLGALSGSGAGSVPETTTVTRVAPGESLSDVAARTAPGADREAVIDRIRDLNGLSSANLRVGQPLTVPFSR